MNIKKKRLKVDEQLCFALYSTSRLLIQNYTPLLKALNLTYLQYLVLLVLWEDDHISVKKIGEKLLLDSGTLSPLLKKLGSKGLILKIRSPEDERSVFIGLTAKGKLFEARSQQIPQQMFCQLGLQSKEVEKLKNQLQVLLNNLVSDGLC